MKKIIPIFCIAISVLTGCNNQNTSANLIESQASIVSTETTSEPTNPGKASESIENPESINITVLSDMVLEKDDFGKTIFIRNTEMVGGIYVIDSTEDILTNPFSGGLSEYLSNTIMPAIDASASDYMIESSTLSYVEVTFSSTDNEYIHYIFRGNDVDYDIWFHRNHFTSEEEHQILQSVIIDAQSAETTASAVPDASSFISQELTFNLPEDMTVTHTQEEGGLISYHGSIIGGYVEAAFRKGVLTDPDSNTEEIISTLVDSVSKYIDLSDFTATVFEDFYIQVRFNNTEVEYIHYVIYFSDVDTYYDIWFDINQVDTNTITQIIDSASIILR